MFYRVMIVDDQPLILRSLSETVPWEQFGCVVVATAEDNLVALQQIQQSPVDILITDIRMPGIDGLSFSEKVLKLCPDMKIIVITAYQEFSYAKRALQLGVSDFVLKPIDDELFANAVQRVVNALNHRQRNLAEHDRLCEYRSKYIDSLSVLRQKLVMDVLYGRVQIVEKTNLIELHLLNKSFITVVVRIRNSNDDSKQQMVCCIFKLVKQKSMALIENVIEGDLVWVFALDGKQSAHTCKQRIHSVMQQLQNEFDPQVSFCAAVSQMTRDILSLQESYQQAVELLDSCFFLTTEQLVFVGDCHAGATADSLTIADMDAFYRELDYSSGDEKPLVVRLMKSLANSTGGNIFAIKCLISVICITLLRRHASGKIPKLELDGQLNTVLEEIDQLSEIESATVFLTKFVQNICKKTVDNVSDNPIVHKALRYIACNFSNADLSLEQLAEHVSTNPSYLSRLLKKETGENFVDILTSVRIEKAKQLLSDPSNRVSEVCRAVGYAEYSYFYQVFKRVENCSPSQFRRVGKKI